MNVETPRLILRRPILADVPKLFEVLGDVEAMRYTHADASLQECRRRVAVHEWRRRRGGEARRDQGRRPDHRLGRPVRRSLRPRLGVEVGYYFDPAVRGRGYATELVTACMSPADDVLLLSEVRAFARPENAGSRRVLEKAGFEVVRLVSEMERFLYRRGRHGGQVAA